MENLELLKKQILLFHEFLIEKLGVPREIFTETNNLIAMAYQEKNIKVLESGEREIYLQLREMPLEKQVELRDLFKEKLNLDLAIFQKLFDKSIEKIIKRGKIVNDEEYRILLDKMDNLTQAKTEDESKKINALLIDYTSK